MICQRTTGAVIHVFTLEGYSADIYLDDFYGAEYPSVAPAAFVRLQELFDELGLQSSPEKDCQPWTRMVCLGTLVDTKQTLFEVPQDRVSDLQAELSQWTNLTTF